MEEFIMKKLMKWLSTLAVLMSMVGCETVSQNTTTQQMGSNVSGVKVAANKTFLRDWTGRTLGTEPQPQWLMQAFLNNYTGARSVYGISEQDIVRVATVKAKDVRSAQMYADMQYARNVARELQQSIVVNAAEKARNGDMSEGTKGAIEEVTQTHAEADITGHEKKTEFYHIVDEEDASTGKVTRCCVLYQVYVIPERTWARTCAYYLKKVLGDIPENLSPDEQDVKDLVSTMIKDGRHPTVMSQQEKEQELEYKRRMLDVQADLAPVQQAAAAQQELLKIAQENKTKRTEIRNEAKTKQVEAVADAKTMAYLSGSPAVESAAFVTPDDAAQIEAEELAMSILFGN